MAGFWKMPHEVAASTDLTLADKVVYSVVASLANNGRGCTASNKTLAGFCGVDRSTIIRVLTRLEDIGLLYMKYKSEHKNSTQRQILLTNCGIRCCTMPPSRKKQQKGSQNATGVVAECDPIRINNRISNKKALPPELEAKRYWNDDQWNDYLHSRPNNRLTEEEADLRFEMDEWRQAEFEKQKGGV